MKWDAEQATLEDSQRFESINGLWTGKKAPFVETGVIRNTNFTESGRIDYSDVARLQVEQKKLEKRQLQMGDIIVERSGGGPKQPVGRVVYFEREDGPFSFSNFTSAIRVRDRNAFDSKFVFFRLLELYQSGRTEDIQRRTTGIRNLDFSAYKERACFPLIPLSEQYKIAWVLGVVQRAIEQQERLIALTTELKKALLHQLFTQGLRGESQKQTEIGSVPESWEVVTLENAALAFDYGTSVKCEHGKAGFPVLRIPNVIGGSIDLGDLKHGQPKRRELEQLRLRDGDLLFVRTNGVLENAGRCALYRGELEGCYFASYLIRVRVDSTKVLPAFVNEYARTERGRSFLSGRAIRTADGKFNINSGTLKRVLLPLPSLDEQQEIIRQLDLIERKLKLHEAKRRALSDLFRTLLHQLMTAQIRVYDLDLDGILSQAVRENGDKRSPVAIGQMKGTT
jgi:type I restriction enzyme S subunit